jgi:hypothetical protein
MPDVKRDLSNYRLETAKQCLKDAANLLNAHSNAKIFVDGVEEYLQKEINIQK